jgi:hypothetical protein
MMCGIINLRQARHHIDILRETTLIEWILSLEGGHTILLLAILTFSLIVFLVNLDH